MLGVFSSNVGRWVKVKLTKIRVDNVVFRLHYRFTFVLLITCCLLVSSRQFIGDNIHCIAEGVPQHVLNTYCFFVATTYTVPHLNVSATVAPGVGPPPLSGLRTEDKKYHAYYQWVPYVLFLQAMMFYLPWWIWKSWEGGKIRTIIQGLNVLTVTPGDRQSKHIILTRYIMETLHNHNKWAFYFFLCEFLNLVNIIGQIYFTNYFLGGEFLTYGSRVIQFMDMDPEDRVDPMIYVFPRMTKCTFQKFGPSGTVQTFDALCLLALNIMNEKIYMCLWFWFIILAVITGIAILGRIATLVSRPLRYYILRAMAPGLLKRRDVEVFMQKSQIGDWFLLCLLGHNMDGVVYVEFFHELCNTLKGKRLSDTSTIKEDLSVYKKLSVE